ncbi:MAG: hypothetical protein FWE40_09170 [Oscillospiraceae bacterium]|nr:hypothetical protein [Oscillospiraceae bacterium]
MYTIARIMLPIGLLMAGFGFLMEGSFDLVYFGFGLFALIGTIAFLRTLIGGQA